MFVKNGTGVLKKVLLSKPQYLKAAPINEIARKWAPELDVAKMLVEHALVVKAYHDAGVATEFLEPDENRPNSVFARNFGGCVREGYILGRFREPLRFQEHTDYAARMQELGVPVIELPVTEILKAGGGPHCMTFPLERV